jgi:hypothetical protein
MTQNNDLYRDLIEAISRLIYEGTRVEATWSKRSIVPEHWEARDQAFRQQFIDLIEKYLDMDPLPSPEEAHNSWMEEYFNMGWKYGPKRDPEAKTHPDLRPFSDLPKDERDKDAVFLVMVWLAKRLLKMLLTAILDFQKQGAQAYRRN